MHLPNRNHKTDDGPVYARRLTLEEVADMLRLTEEVVDYGCECRMCVPGPIETPITATEIRTGHSAPIGNETTPPFGASDAGSPGCVGTDYVPGPDHEVADLEAQRRFDEANVKLAQAYLRRQDCLMEQAESVPVLDERGFLSLGLEDMHAPGAKSDKGKLDYTLVPTELEEAVCEILMFGAKKYSRDGWRSVPDAHVRYLAALERHIKAFKRGEDCDPESGLHHLAHAACNLAFLLHFLRNGEDVGSWRHEEEHYNGA